MTARQTVWIAVDPGAKSGIAVKFPGEQMFTFPVKGIPPVGSSDLEFDTIHSHVLDENLRVVCVIERSHAKIARFSAHRADANKWQAFLKNKFARRNTIYFADPKTWQAHLGVCPPGSGGVLPYDRYARGYLKVRTDATTDECAAACLLHYGRRVYVSQDRPGERWSEEK